MKLSYAICVCDESRELDELILFLKTVKDDEDEIVILIDSGKVTDGVRNVLSKYKNILVSEREFTGNFAEHRNYHQALCSGDYIFAIDADEMPREEFIKKLKDTIATSNMDLLYVPRINIIPGYTKEWLSKYKFKINENGWINWPDYQGRIYKNNGIIKWTKGLHETVDGATRVGMFPGEPSHALWHIKNIQRQEDQDTFYKSLK
jgi:hypothetical protein